MVRTLHTKAAVRRLTATAIVVCLATSAEARPRSGKPASKAAIAQAQDTEPARTNRPVAVRKKPNPRATAVGQLPANAVVIVEREDSGWLRIRAKHPKTKQDIVGYVPKTTVKLPAQIASAPTDDLQATDIPIPRESRQTTDQVVLRDKPGEKQAPLATLPSGATVIVEAERGRWLRVRSGKLVGYLARTTVTTPPPPATVVAAVEPEPVVETTAVSGWSSRRSDPSSGTSTQLYAEVTGAAALRADPKLDAPVVVEMQRGSRLVVVDASSTAGWVRARDEHGAEGWIPLDRVGNGSAAVALSSAIPTAEVATEKRDATRPASERHGLELHIDMGVGYRVIGMNFTSNGTAGLANYLVSADASAADVGVDMVMFRAGKLSLGIDGELEASDSSPGISYAGPSQPGGRIPFSTLDVDAGVRAGFRTRRLFELAVRGGVHYDAFIAEDVDNAGMLPRERLFGATLGARADVVPPGSRFGATLHADALVVGSRRQTPGLEDGTSSTERAVWAGMIVRVRLARHFSLLSAYDFARVTTQWSGVSVRMPGVTNARRVDSSQLVQLGLSIDL